MSADSKLTEPSQPVIHQAYKGRYQNGNPETIVLYLGTRHSIPQVKASFKGQIKFHEATLTHENNEPVFVIGNEVH